VLIGERNHGKFKIEGRQVEGFYGEYKIIFGQYTDIRSFKNADMLQSYLDQMGNIDYTIFR
jgi:hypothetical protein